MSDFFAFKLPSDKLAQQTSSSKFLLQKTSNPKPETSDFNFKFSVSGFGFEVSGCGIKVPGSGLGILQLQGFGFRVKGLGTRHMEP